MSESSPETPCTPTNLAVAISDGESCEIETATSDESNSLPIEETSPAATASLDASQPTPELASPSANAPNVDATPCDTNEVSADVPNADATPSSDAVPNADEEPKAKAKQPKPATPPARIVATPAPASVATPDAADLFGGLPLAAEVHEAIGIIGYKEPTPIQAQIIPLMLAGKDILAQSQTGTGKTAAFALPILSRLRPTTKFPQVLVLAPTRELAIQVARSFSQYGRRIPDFAVAAIYGGQDYEPQLKQLRRGVHVVVGTPGRVIDHIDRGTLNLSQLGCLVLDEADQMLNMGFLPDVQRVLTETPKERQTALFSATLPQPIREIAQQYLKSPEKVTIKEDTLTVAAVRQRALFVPGHAKADALARLLEAEETDGVIVFTKTKDSTIIVAEQLSAEGFSAIALNGDMPQKVRERAIDSLKSGRLDVLVATDVAARGLDVPRVSHVINFDLPHDAESYVHRIGRTGRAGRGGEAIIFLTNAQRRKLQMLENATGQQIEVITTPSTKQINALRVKQFKQKIAETVETADLEMFLTMIREHGEESGTPMDKIAAALAHLGQNGRPFYKPEPPARRQRERTDNRGGKPSYRNSDEGRPARSFGPPQSGMRRFRIDVGRQDGVRPGNIVGAVANEAGLTGRSIGSISIHQAHSTIDLPGDLPPAVYETLRNTWVSGKQLRLRAATAEDNVPGDSGPGFKKRNPKRHKPHLQEGKRISANKKKAHGRRKKLQAKT